MSLRLQIVENQIQNYITETSGEKKSFFIIVRCVDRSNVYAQWKLKIFPQFLGNDTYIFELLEYFGAIKKEIDTKIITLHRLKSAIRATKMQYFIT